MTQCKNCGKSHTNGSKFCTRKCRKSFMRKNTEKMKVKYKGKINDGDYLLNAGITGRGVFDCDGNYQKQLNLTKNKQS